MADVNGVTDKINKCPACGSTNVGVSEMPGSGHGRFGLVCSDCRWTIGQCASKLAAFEEHGAVLLNYDNGVKELPAGSQKVEDRLAENQTLKMVTGEKLPPTAGVLNLAPLGTRVHSPFRTKEDQERFAAGEPAPEIVTCECCKASQQGAEVRGKGGTYHALPAGWYLHISETSGKGGEVLCSLLCVRAMEKRA